jgi:hypothetical protein
MALGQEFFVWFVMIPRVSGMIQRKEGSFQLIKSFITNPALTAIFIGLFMNIIGFLRWGQNAAAAQIFLSALEKLPPLIVPLILIIIGYNMKMQLESLKQTFFLFLQRIFLMLPLSLLFIYLVMQKILNLDEYYIYGLLTLILLPPPFIIPLFLPSERKKELPEINSILMSYTLISVLFFFLLVVIVNL